MFMYVYKFLGISTSHLLAKLDKFGRDPYRKRSRAKKRDHRKWKLERLGIAVENQGVDPERVKWEKKWRRRIKSTVTSAEMTEYLKAARQSIFPEAEVEPFRFPRPSEFHAWVEKRRLESLRTLQKKQRKFSVEQFLEIYLLHRDGLSNRAIAKRYGASHTSINKWIQKIEAAFAKASLL